MIVLTIYSKKENIYKFSLKGHAGFEENGKDIICAGVSAIAQTTIGSLKDLVKVKMQYNLEDGWIECELEAQDLTKEQKIQVKVLMASLLLGCKQIQYSYGKQYIRIEELKK